MLYVVSGADSSQGGIIALTEIIITDLIPLRLRGQWFGIISGMWSIGSGTYSPPPSS
jgi:hypothetical protein